MTDCIFCKIINGEVPSEKIYEDDNIYAFLDVSPIQPGHTLVVPKNHCTELADVTNIGALFGAVRQLGPAIKTAVGADAYNVGMNNGEAAGQSVFHAHVHIIPRKVDDGLTMWSGKQAVQGENAIIAAKIRENL